MGNVMTIDWSKMPRPRADQYDTRRIELLATKAYKFKKKRGQVLGRAMFDGYVPIVDGGRKPSEELETANLSHRALARGDELLKKIWPEMWEQARALLTGIWPIWPVGHIENDSDSAGCICGGTSEFGGIMVSVHQGSIGFIEGIVHELGHWKLHAMGVHLESWDNLVANDPSELFESPIRKDIPRPMGACIQAQYSYLHVLELNIRGYKNGVDFGMLDTNVARMTAGRETLKAWKPDKNGVKFAQAMDDWTAELLDEGNALLAEKKKE